MLTMAEDSPKQSVIVQGSDLSAVREAVLSVGGEITHELGIIRSVGAKLTGAQLEKLRTFKQVRKVYENSGVETSAVDKPACSVRGKTKLRMKGDQIEWELTNDGSGDVHLDSATLFWPAANDRLTEVEMNGDEIIEDETTGVSATFGSEDWEGDDRDIMIKRGRHTKFSLQFDNDVVRDQRSYEIRLVFREGCSVEFPPPPDILFSGDSDRQAKRSYVTSMVDAGRLHDQAIDGMGVAVAVIDSGIRAKAGMMKYLDEGAWGNRRLLAQYDALKGREIRRDSDSDDNGHGSHVSSIIASSRYKDGEFNGIAPNVDLVMVKAFNAEGRGSYADVIRGLDWVVSHRHEYGIGVVNLSFSTEPRSYYWDDPLNQAVMAAWESGIVVVASAGNRGPDAMTIGVPGNVPYIITVGAMTDSMTPTISDDDTLASFSSAGPTVEGFVKPEIVAPGGHIRGMMDKGNKLVKEHPLFHDGDSYYTMSGTSQSTAVVSGVVALLLQAHPELTPDEVKCRLMASARPAVNNRDEL
ncbi:S8 family peptidase, partial [Thiolapillus sp.]